MKIVKYAIGITLIYLTSAALCATAGNAVFENDKVSISVTISSSIYEYEVTNRDSEPIVGFEIYQHAAYNFMAPDKWEIESTDKIFRARTDEIR